MLFSQLTAEDKNKIEYYITHYANESKGKTYTPLTTSLEYILRYWNEAKANLYPILGNQFIASKHISIDKPVELIGNDLYSKDEVTNFLYKIRRGIDQWFNHEKHTWADYEHLYALSQYNSNSVCRNRAEYDIDVKINGERVKISEGEKTTKALKKLVKAFGIEEEMYEAFRIAHSQVLNDKKLEGELCVSIHPLDFMTMSDNTLNWSSCMKWESNGCYKAGTVEMMNSPNVVVAYLRHPTDMEIGEDMTWNNKRWRCLYIIEDDMIMSVKSYPYYSPMLHTVGGEFIAELFNSNIEYRFDASRGEIAEWTGSWDRPFTTSYRRIGEFITGRMYNDIEESWGDHYILTDLKAPIDNSRDLPIDEIEYSGKSECMFCGQHMTHHGGVEDLICGDCYEVHRCRDCYTLIFDNTGHIYCDNYYCQKCYEDHFIMCDITGRKAPRSDIGYVYMVKNHNNYLTPKNVIRKFAISIPHYYDVINNSQGWFLGSRLPYRDLDFDSWDSYPCFSPQMLTEAGRELFDVKGENE